MILNSEQIRRKAHELALTHEPYNKNNPVRLLRREYERDVKMLRDIVKAFRQGGALCAQPAEEWLLDHAEFLEEQLLIIKQMLDRTSLKNLPLMRKSNHIRIMDLCLDYLDFTDGILDEETLVTYIESYQEVSILTTAESWSFPLFLRVALLRRLTGVMELVRQRRDVCFLVEKTLIQLETAELTPEILHTALEKAGIDMPLSGGIIVHLVKHLRERAEEPAEVREWLLCKLDNGLESFDRLVSYEYQLQASHQVAAGHIIVSMRKLSRWDWNRSFERISVVENTLNEDISGVYPLLDFASRDVLRRQVEKLASRLHLPENLVAKQSVDLATEAMEACHSTASAERSLPKPDAGHYPDNLGKAPRRTFLGYYLLEPDGIKLLRDALNMCGAPRNLPVIDVSRYATEIYFSGMAALGFFLLFAGAIWIKGNTSFTVIQWLAVLSVLLLPVSEWVTTVTHWFIGRVRQPRVILRYDFAAGIPPAATTMVVIPVIWSSVKEVEEMADRIELHYLSNRDPNLHFALLGDLSDGSKETMPADREIINAACNSIEQLNKKYYHSGGSSFHLFQRRRLWNPAESVWMGWERKRGKLVEFVELLQGSDNTSFEWIRGDRDILANVRYVLTLDADTQLPISSAHQMIGAIHLPYNRPRLNRQGTRVVEGYGVLQPRIAVSHKAAWRSRFAYLWSANPGIDPYTFAASDPYQDGLGQGIFTGKGIFDVEVFSKVLNGRIPENRVLSHDLLEGGFLRTGLMSDIELVDEHPATFSAYQKRMHRWVRGDWQLLIWLGRLVNNRQGEPETVDLAYLTRWQILDNLRRSLQSVALLVLLLLGSKFLPGSPERWFAMLLATFFLPLWRQLLDIRQVFWRPRNLLAITCQVLMTILTLPFQVILVLDAVGRTLYRLFISKKNLLKWVSAAEIERREQGRQRRPVQGLLGGYFLALMLFWLTWGSTMLMWRWTGVVLGAFWLAAPLMIRWMDQPWRLPERPLTQEDIVELHQLARRIWQFFEDYVTAAEHWLPPDNVQIDPPIGVARRTSPTNIGLYLTSVLVARDFGFIDTLGLIERLERTVTTLEKMKKWRGHLYNWYDTDTLEPLPPMYVSTVDSGNLAACLITLKEGLAQWLKTEENALQTSDTDSRFRKHSQDFSVAFAQELAVLPPSAEKTGQSGQAAVMQLNRTSWAGRGQRLITQLERLINETDFSELYDHRSKLMRLGYHAGSHEPDQVLYDLLASESRLTSFIAIAQGQVPVSHWHALGRTMTRIGRRVALLSWSGTMFEYLMPWLFMRTYRNTLWDSTYQAVVKRQVEYAERQRVPLGISESGYYAFDLRMNYQYRAFGVPGLGFKRGLEQDLVVAPYATVLALPFAQKQAIASLHRLKKLGAYGQYGFYEAIDFTTQRLPKEQPMRIICSFMSHHQGMSLLALANLLAPQKVYERFHRDKRIRSTELLLQERIPARPNIINHYALDQVPIMERHQEVLGAFREFSGANTPMPEVAVLSNGSFMTVITNSGSGFNRYAGRAISRWREDPVLDDWGSYLYIHDLNDAVVWSPSYQPCRVVADEERVQFFLDRANFLRVDGDLRSNMEICVSPEWNAEVRRLTLSNTGAVDRLIEITSFIELALASPMADDAHPVFSKLFIETEYVSEHQCLLANRRPRQDDEKPLWAAHSLIAQSNTIGPAEYDSDRILFIGRGNTIARPQGIYARLRGTQGAVGDPALIMRRRFKIPAGEKVQLFAVTAAADTRTQVLETIDRFTGGLDVDRTIQMAWNRSQIELHHLHLTASQAMTMQVLAGRILYNQPFIQERQQNIAVCLKGQSGLWAYGISGDIPMVLVQIADKSELPQISNILTGHEYLRRLGLIFDLVLLNQSVEGYQRELHDALGQLVEQVTHRQGNSTDRIFVIDENQLSDPDRILLTAVAKVILRTNGPSIKAQLKHSKNLKPAKQARRDGLSPETHNKTLTATQTFAQINTAQDARLQMEFLNSWGGFVQDGHAYRMFVKKGQNPPMPWSNVLANPHFGCLVTELGTGYTWWRNSRECKLTPWSNDPVLDPPGEICYLRDDDSGTLWSATWAAIADQDVLVTHGHGYTCFQQRNNGIRNETTMFVHRNEPVKVLLLQLQNEGEVKRHLSVTYYVEWVLGVLRQTNAPYIVTEWDPEGLLLLAKNTYQEAFREATAFMGVYPAEGDDTTASDISWTADRGEFLGRNGVLSHPEALSSNRVLSGNVGAVYNSCGAVQVKLTLDPKGKRTVCILLGCAENSADAQALAQKYREKAACQKALEEVQTFWTDTLSQTVVATPCREMDILLNGWLLYQTLSCRMWARAGFYQAGGAYGFRDQLQDALALLHTRPDLARSQILRHAARQYKEGDVQHWWHEETQHGIRTRFSDDLLWLPYVVGRYVEHTGDQSILEERMPYLSSVPLNKDEHERYELAAESHRQGSVYERCLLAINRAVQQFGEHGLPLIGSGDWNDGMNNVGVQGRGESVWLGWFLCILLDMFIEMCKQQKDAENAEHYEKVRIKLVVALQKEAWDGQWYRRAFTDSGQWLGSIYNEECRIDALAQSWAVLAGVTSKEQQLQAMDSFDRELMDRQNAVARLLTPPFHKTKPSPGYIQSYPPGVRENGAQYTHGIIWCIMAWCKLNRGDKAVELYQMLNPINHTRTPGEVRQYTGEPYVMAADVYTEAPRQGHAGWTWYTGAAGWMYQAGLEWILGLRRQGEKLYINPCIPQEWPGFTVNYRYGRSAYQVVVQNNGCKSVSKRACRMTIDGQVVCLAEHEAEQGPYVMLQDDGLVHKVAIDITTGMC